MSLTSKIKSIINTLYPAATYTLASKFKANIQSFDLTTLQLPFIILDNELLKTAEIKKNNNITKDSKIIITILNKDDVYNSDDESNYIIEGCEEIADRIAVNVYQLPEIMPINGNQKYKIIPAFHVFNTDLSGVILEMQANEILTARFCPENVLPEILLG